MESRVPARLPPPQTGEAPVPSQVICESSADRALAPSTPSGHSPHRRLRAVLRRPLPDNLLVPVTRQSPRFLPDPPPFPTLPPNRISPSPPPIPPFAYSPPTTT